MRFRDRREAGRKLAKALAHYGPQGEEIIVLGLPRGGLLPAREIADTLKAPLSVFVVRKIGHPQNPEYAIGAVTADGEFLVNEAEASLIPNSELRGEIAREIKEAKRRERHYLRGENLEINGKVAILVDDGVATGLTFLLAVRALRKKGPARIVAAIPVIPADTAKILRREVDELVILDAPGDYLGAVGAYYDYFPQLTDEEVLELLDGYRGRRAM